MEKTFELVVQVPMQLDVTPPAGAAAGEAAAAGGWLRRAAVRADTEADPAGSTLPAIAGGSDESCDASARSLIQLPVNLVLEVRVRADCRVRDISIGVPTSR